MKCNNYIPNGFKITNNINSGTFSKNYRSYNHLIILNLIGFDLFRAISRNDLLLRSIVLQLIMSFSIVKCI